jgi:hypothetical protein
MAESGKSVIVGLASNPGEVHFQCGTCHFYSEDPSECLNPNPKLHKRHVDAEWCCNLYHHDGMKIIVS